jgi:hypothetical protein
MQTIGRFSPRAAIAAVVVLSLSLTACDAGGVFDDDDDEQTDLLDLAATAPLTTTTLTASDVNIMNPERGYYRGVNLLDPNQPKSVRAAGYTMGIAIVRLDAYKTSAIDAAFIAKLNTGFAAVRAAGIKVVLRFTYNSGYTGDATKDRILQHIGQLKQLMIDNQDVIAVVQAGFIGAWGEWHSSTNGNDTTANRSAVLTALLAAVPSARTVQIRTPMFKEAIMPGGPLSPTEAWSGSNRARTGHHNDCFLASSSDFGTYSSPVDTWKDYVGNDGTYTAVGGETCAVSSRSTCATAPAEMEALGFSYLNYEYNRAVLDTWETGGCGSSIRRRLGYRFTASSVSHTTAVAPGGELSLSVTLKNSGYAAPYNARPVYVVLSQGTTRYVTRLKGRDGRRWIPGAISVAAKLRVPASAPVGTYEVGIWMPDAASKVFNDPRYAIQFANAGTWNATTGVNVLSKAVKIDRAATGGTIDPTATTFAEIL